jgi:hypothetical protein
LPQWPVAHNKICRSNQEVLTKFAAVAVAQKDIKSTVEYLGKFESIFKTALITNQGTALYALWSMLCAVGHSAGFGSSLWAIVNNPAEEIRKNFRVLGH